jgi:polyferredoxin
LLQLGITRVIARLKYRTWHENLEGNFLKTVTKIGLGFLAFGFLLFVGLVLLVLMFAVGSSGSPLSSPLAEFVSFSFTLGIYWYIFVIVGVVLILVGALQRRRTPTDKTRSL